MKNNAALLRTMLASFLNKIKNFKIMQLKMNKLSQCQLKLIDKKINIEKNKYIVQLDVSGDKSISERELNANIYCIDGCNNILWQINASHGTYDGDPFVSLELTHKNKLVARRFFGKKYLIDIESGFAEETGWEK